LEAEPERSEKKYIIYSGQSAAYLRHVKQAVVRVAQTAAVDETYAVVQKYLKKIDM